MFSVRVPVGREGFDELIEALGEAGTTGIIEGPGYVDAFFETREVAESRWNARRSIGSARPKTRGLRC
jgi:hypothetical protein